MTMTTIEICAYAPNRETAIAFLQAINIADVDEAGNIIPIADVQIHPSRPEETISIEGVPGFHWNMRFYGTSAATLTKPTPPGGWPENATLFDKTAINELVAGRLGEIPQWVEDETAIPNGYEAGSCRAFDPATITHRANVWA